jgi:hypothetical protein
MGKRPGSLIQKVEEEEEFCLKSVEILICCVLKVVEMIFILKKETKVRKHI